MLAKPVDKPVVVGVDDRLTSRIALDWAIDEANRRGMPLHIVHTHQVPTGPPLAPAESKAGGQEATVVAEALSRARALAPQLEVTTESSTLRASVALVDASRQAACVVVGARGRGAVVAAFLGTTSLDVAEHAACPVVVVRELPHAAETPSRVVVGADGSPVSAAAIGYAFAQASERQVPLTVVHVWAPEGNRMHLVTQHVDSDLKAITEQEQALAAEEVAGWARSIPTSRSTAMSCMVTR